ncbi:MAG: radical SAM protein [Desulfobacteraceae bacterium]|nr:radical SAM protein [Desulfobacteraceae bacterium]
MKILLLNPPFKSEFGRFSREQRSPAITKGGTFYFPMFLCYAAGVLEQAGFDVLLTDGPASQMSHSEVYEKAKAFAPDMIIVDTSTPSIYNDIEMAEQLKQVTGALTVLVGTHPAIMVEETLGMSDKVDAIARKEYEYTLRDLAQKISIAGGHIDETILESVKGLSFKWEGKIKNNPDRQPIENLDELPFVSGVYKKHLNIRDYFYTIAQHPQVAIYSGRGCPHQCIYCVYPQVMHGHRYRNRSVDNLIEEFKYIEHELPEVREIFIEDDTFTVDRKRVAAFSKAYQNAKLKISWIANSRADTDHDTLRALRLCNCRLLCVGFESGDQGVLNTMNKRLNVEDAKTFVKNARNQGILIHGCFMVGNPGETWETLEKTLEYAKMLNPDTAQFFPIMVYPGTKAYDWAKENRYLLSEDYSQWNTATGLHNCMISRPGLSNVELVEFCDRARKEFYLRPRYILYRLLRLLKHPIEDGPRMIKSVSVFKKFLFKGTFDR